MFGMAMQSLTRSPLLPARRQRENEGEGYPGQDPRQDLGEQASAPLPKRRRTEAEKEEIREEQAKQLAAQQQRERAEAGNPLPALAPGV